MRVRFGVLREYLREAVLMNKMTSASAADDPDARVPGHLENELPPSASLEEQGWIPGRWFPNGLEAEPYDHERLGTSDGEPSGAEMDETDDRMIGDGKGNGIPDPNEGEDAELKMSPHLKGDDEKTSLGDPPEEKPEALFGETRWLNREIKKYLLQEYPAGTSLADPTKDPKGFYSSFDMAKDHGDGDYIQKPWYQTPGRPQGTEGDIRREEDPAAQLKMHPNEGDPTTMHPSLMGLDGFKALRAPEIGALTGGSDTSKMLGANAKPGASDVDSDGESEEGEEGEAGTQGGEDGEQGQSEEQA